MCLWRSFTFRSTGLLSWNSKILCAQLLSQQKYQAKREWGENWKPRNDTLPKVEEKIWQDEQPARLRFFLFLFVTWRALPATLPSVSFRGVSSRRGENNRCFRSGHLLANQFLQALPEVNHKMIYSLFNEIFLNNCKDYFIPSDRIFVVWEGGSFHWQGDGL